MKSLGIPAKLRDADKFWELEHSNLNSFFGQRTLANRLSRISPISIYENVIAILAGTDLTSFEDFINQVKIHRNEVVGYIRSRTDNFFSPSFFAVCPEEESAA